eukprot:TRINITY_DN5048_c0_g1_i1.p1 TRINITY_DN5048_c0_g1~~TRINITY_DN5048_c0_g1_i1.p1  ORF type:complete len:158 (+),score=39.69 TRINITY_DN5048_c0_g1_i1:73-546(+)
MSGGSSFISKLGVVASSLCLIDCVVLPIVLAVLNLLKVASFVNDDWVHAIHEFSHHHAIYFIAPISFISLLLGYFHHKSLSLVVIGLSALSAMVYASFYVHGDEQLENRLSLGGSFVLFLVQMRIRSLEKCCDHDHDHGHKGQQSAKKQTQKPIKKD